MADGDNQATGLRIPEHVLRNLIGFGLQRVRQSVHDVRHNLIDELFARLPADARKQIKDYLVTHVNLPVTVNWPRDDAMLPLLCIVNDSSVEAEDARVMGDFGGVHVMGSAPNATWRQTRRIPDRNTSTIYVATDDANLTMYLSILVRFILVSNKDELTKWHDIHDLSASMHDVKWDGTFLPKFCYIRAITASYMTYFDFYVGEEASQLVSFALLVETEAGGVPVVSPFPSTDS